MNNETINNILTFLMLLSLVLQFYVEAKIKNVLIKAGYKVKWIPFGWIWHGTKKYNNVIAKEQDEPKRKELKLLMIYMKLLRLSIIILLIAWVITFVRMYG